MMRSLMCIFLVLFGTSAMADSFTVNFNMQLAGDVLNTVPSAGTLTLILNADGTISATLTAVQPVVGLGFNGPVLDVHVPLSGFSPALSPTGNTLGWAAGDFGYYNSGFDVGGYQGALTVTAYTFTVGNSGQFSSVWDIANFYSSNESGSGSVCIGCPDKTQFFLFEGYQVYGGNAPTHPSQIPEPSTAVLLSIGSIGLGLKRKPLLRVLVPLLVIFALGCSMLAQQQESLGDAARRLRAEKQKDLDDVATAVLPEAAAAGRPTAPIAKSEILSWIVGGVLQEDATAEINSRSIDFEADADFLRSLESISAGKTMIDAIKKSNRKAGIPGTDDAITVNTIMQVSAAMKRRDSETALSMLMNQLKADEKNADLFFVLAKIADDAGDSEAAIRGVHPRD